MKVGLSVRLVRIGRTALLTVAVCAIAFQLCSFFGLRVNTSPSLPIGLYKITADGTGSLVEFCPPEPFAALSLVRGFRSAGSCPDGGAPLLKPIIARPGDLVEISSRGIAVNGVLLANTAPLTQDSRGRPLKTWRYGSFVVATRTVWVASSYNSHSFDSRYFGPISTLRIRDRLRPLFTL